MRIFWPETTPLTSVSIHILQVYTLLLGILILSTLIESVNVNNAQQLTPELGDAPDGSEGFQVYSRSPLCALSMK